MSIKTVTKCKILNLNFERMNKNYRGILSTSYSNNMSLGKNERKCIK